MKLLSAKQFQEWDAYTICHEPISSIELMERAALLCTETIARYFSIDQVIKVFCAKGNNGGDGLAIARLLIGRGYEVSVYVLEQGKIGSNDFQANLHRLHSFTTEIHFIQSAEAFPIVQETDLLIDALYGTGLKSELIELPKALVEFLNLSGAQIISIDIPSGMYVDQSSNGNTIIKANTTFSFQALKLCFLAAENAPHFGNVVLLNIQLQPGFLKTVASDYDLLEKEKVRLLVKPRNDFSHKGKFGHALLIAGSIGKMGAAILSARAAMRSGIGMLTISIPTNTDAEIHTAIPEAMVLNRETSVVDFDKFSTIGIGPGIGTDLDSETVLENIIEHFKKPILLDADAITILSKHPDWLSRISSDSILTPHPKEFDRLFGESANEFKRWQKAVQLSEQHQLIILVKGHHTLIAAKGKAWFNSTGNVGLAKAGSGDTLSGIITSLLAQGYASTVAAILGVYLHGLAADLALGFQSTESLLASDIIECIGMAFNDLANYEN
ncbi:MAG: NAD(P)H-hydrate dehydratase [Bacteroidetes bacterium]|nr:NAD(P)H-hydrate dehydratase [Bacteroidota bacterium]